VSVEVLDETGTGADVDALAGLSRFVLDRMRLHPDAELCLKLVDEGVMSELNRRFMDATGPTDVLAFPMDELRPGGAGDPVEARPDGQLGDVALCPAVAARNAAERDRSVADEVDLLVVHGILHLLGYDHAEPDDHREMFDLQAGLLAEWQRVRDNQLVRDDGSL